MFTRIFPEGCSRETTAFMEECYGKWPIIYLPKDIAKKRDKKITQDNVEWACVVCSDYNECNVASKPKNISNIFV
jgi:hypothetical protein